jgi:hypothetical protein
MAAMSPVTTRKWFVLPSRRICILAVVALVEIVVFVNHHTQRWNKALVRRQDARIQSGEGLVIRCDGLGYYAWLRSILFDGDCSFDNEFDEHNPLGDAVPPPTARTALGSRSNHWSVGPACVWAVAVLPVHGCLLAIEPSTNEGGWTGYEWPYQIAVGIATFLASIVGLGFMYGTCRHFAGADVAALAAGMLTLGSTIVFYSAVEVTMAHGLGTAAVSGLIWYWLRTFGSSRPGRWLMVGILVGLVALMRWQLVTFALLPVGECWHLGWQRRGGATGYSCGQAAWGLGLAGLGAVVAFSPQLLAWKAVYGSWLVSPLATSHNWLSPSWGQVLGSADRGLFYWTPVAVLAVVGAMLACRVGALEAAAGERRSRDQARILLMAFGLQVYVVASLWGEQVQLGVSFGFRHLTEALVALAGGLAFLLERASGRWFRVLAGLACLLVFWNLLLIEQYRYGLVPAADGAEPAALLANARRLIYRKKLLLLGPVLAGPLLLWLLAGRRRGRGNASQSTYNDVSPGLGNVSPLPAEDVHAVALPHHCNSHGCGRAPRSESGGRPDR